MRHSNDLIGMIGFVCESLFMVKQHFVMTYIMSSISQTKPTIDIDKMKPSKLRYLLERTDLFVLRT